jgi:hypothetical protein
MLSCRRSKVRVQLDYERLSAFDCCLRGAAVGDAEKGAQQVASSELHLSHSDNKL